MYVHCVQNRNKMFMRNAGVVYYARYTNESAICSFTTF